MRQMLIAGTLILANLIGGCQPNSERLAEMADRTVEMQSKQNSTIAKTSGELVKLYRDIQTERRQLNERTSELDLERQAIHRERRSELAWAESFRFLAIVIAATMPLFLCAYLIWATSRPSTDQEAVNEILIRELVSAKPRFMTGPNLMAIETQSETDDTTTHTNNGGSENDGDR